MSNIKANAAICEICGGKLMLRSVEAFECESCGANYPKDWVRAKVQEITGTVKVEGPVEVTGKVQIDGDFSGSDNADALYNRALGWLNLQNEAKAIVALEDMVEKYPADKRGWQKLAFLLPIPDNKVYMEAAVNFDDADFIKAIGEDRVERNRVAMTICDEIREGGGVECLEKIVDIAPWSKSESIELTVKPSFDFPCVNELLSEGKKNAAAWNSMKLFWWETKELLETEWKISEPHSRVENLEPSYGSLGKAFFIHSGMIGFAVETCNRYSYYCHWFTCETLLSESVINQAFSEIREKRIDEHRKAGLCTKCGGNKNIFGKCKACGFKLY